ncbi:MAG: NTP transferase domain-containing protein [Candidatus Njordarchaeia archaeon]
MSLEITNCLILAAGQSRRLSHYTHGKSKLIIHVNGSPLIFYPINVMLTKNVKSFHIVANKKNYAELIKLTTKVKEADFNVIINAHPELGNGYSFLLGAKHIPSKFFYLSMGDHIYTPSILEKLLESFSRDTDLLIGADSEPKFIDIKEATKIYAQNGDVKRIGKRLRRFTHVDIGVFIVKKSLLELFEDEEWTEPVSFSDIINAAIRGGYKVKVADIQGDYWTEIDTEKDLLELLYGRRNEVLKALSKIMTADISQLLTTNRYLENSDLSAP